MNGKEFKIVFKQDKAYLTDDKPMSLEKAGLSNTYATQTGFKSPAYWTIRVINYRESEKKIFCEVLSYHLGETEFEHNQKQLSNELNGLEAVTYKNINTAGLLKTLSGGGSGSFFPSQHVSTDWTESVHQSAQYVRDPYKQTITETFTVPQKMFVSYLVAYRLTESLKDKRKLLS